MLSVSSAVLIVRGPSKNPIWRKSNHLAPERRRNAAGTRAEFRRNLAGTSPEHSAHPGGTRFCDRQAQPGTFKSEFRTHSAYSAKIPRPSAVKKIRGLK